MRVAYLDHAATAPVRPEVLEAMVPFLGAGFGNPSGSHAVARRARAAVDEARDVVAAFLGGHPSEVVFTSGGTEADNLAVAGVVGARPGTTAVCTAVEHDAVLRSVHAAGGRVASVSADGVVDLDDLARCVAAGEGAPAAVVSVMLVNNETGVVQPLEEAAAVARRSRPEIVVHTDAVQAAPWLDLASAAAPADLVSVSAHKIGGPQGVGALLVRAGTALEPLFHGGGQEHDRRSGTHNVAGIAGLAAACAATKANREADVARVAGLRRRLEQGLLAAVTGARATTSAPTVAGICHLLVPGVESEALLVLADDGGVCASAGSACASGAMEPSHVLLAMGVDKADALSSIRLSLGPTTTEADIDLALSVLPAAVERLRR